MLIICYVYYLFEVKDYKVYVHVYEFTLFFTISRFSFWRTRGSNANAARANRCTRRTNAPPFAKEKMEALIRFVACNAID